MSDDHYDYYSQPAYLRRQYEEAMRLSLVASNRSASAANRAAEAASVTREAIEGLEDHLHSFSRRTNQQLADNADAMRGFFDQITSDGIEQRKITRHALLTRKFEAMGHSSFEAFELAYEQVEREEEQRQLRVWIHSRSSWLKLRQNGDLDLDDIGPDHSANQTYENALTDGENPNKIVYIRTPQQIAEGKAK